ncbi:MAG: OmpA family protein [Chromatiales bacterium]|nr:OmpA family protein [Chromatiales bacterium]
MRRTTAITTTAIGASLLLGAAVAQAAEEVGQAYLKGLGTYIFADSDRHVDDDFAGGAVGFGYALSEHFNIEFDFQRLNMDGDGTFDGGEGVGLVAYPDQEQSAVNVNLMNIYNRSGTFSPYILAGLGVVNTDIGSEDGDDLQGQLGVGVLTKLWGSRLSLRTEALARGQDASDNLTDILVNVGFSLALGSKAAPVAVAAPVAAAAPPPPPPPPPAPPADTDGDGVIDANDQCPDTPRGERVGPQGCTCDVTRQLTFKLNSAELTAEDKKVLDEVAENLTRLKFISGTVVGHTDSSGSEAYNQGLSERRAQSTVDYLATRGIDPSRLKASGAGESQPIADNKTKEGRAQNRRVVLSRTDCDAPN